MTAPVTYTEQNMEAALCLWEVFIEGSAFEDIDALRATVGTPELRMLFMDPVILDAVDEGYKAAVGEGFCDPFDWEFCPSFLLRCVEVVERRVTYGKIRTLALRDGWMEICKEIGRQPNWSQPPEK
jgi:hypothetical protein